MKLNDIILPDGKKIGEKHHNHIIKYLTDGGAIEKYNDGTIFYVDANNKRHRTDGPAVIHYNGTKEWYKNGKIHRTDGPAYISANGSKQWYVNGELHRTDGPAVMYAGGTQEWYMNGKRIHPPRDNNNEN